mgnify:CR=1 FL=1
MVDKCVREALGKCVRGALDKYPYSLISRMTLVDLRIFGEKPRKK